jgi:hypothetical protein
MAESFNDGIGDNEAYIRREEHWDHVNGRVRRSNSTYDEAMQFNLNPRNEGHRAVESEFMPLHAGCRKARTSYADCSKCMGGQSFCHSTMPFFFEQLQKATPRRIFADKLSHFFPKTGSNQRSYIEAATKMSARGGRGGFARGGLKGATWEHDPGVKLESAPSELFPVCQLEPLTEGNHTNRSRNTPISLLLHP